MKIFGKILKFELKNFFTNKVFVGVTAFFMVALALVMCIPRFVEMFKNDEQEVETTPEVMLLGGDSAQLAQTAFAGAFANYEVVLFQGDAAAMEEKITSGGAACGFFLDSMTEYTYYVDNLTMYDTNTALADEVLREVYRTQAMIAGGLNPEDAVQIMSTVISHEVVTLGKDQIQNYLYTYIMIMALYMVIMLYGQMVATNVATEKSSRAMELLITSVKPTSMMFGKVIASCIAGLTQLTAIFGTALVSFRLNRQYWGGEIGAMLDIPPYLLGYMLVFFVLGFFMYAFLYGAVGSTASKLEDINTSVTPITLLFIVGFMVVIFSITSGSVDNLLMKVCSFVPFTAPMAMFARIAMSTVPVYEILISVGLLVGGVAVVGVAAAKIYRMGVLLYGTSPKIKDILKMLKKA